MVNNIPVNGWPQLKDLEAVQPTLDRLDKIEAWKRTVKEETFTGEEITIPNALALPARSLITEINAVQDLHGQSAPYVGGAGKNKLLLTVDSIKTASGATWTDNSYTVGGVTFTILTDDANNVIGIKMNGKSTAIFALSIYDQSEDATIYNGMILNGVANGSASTYGMRISDTAVQSLYNYTGDTSINGLTNTGRTQVVIRFMATDVEVNNVIIYPMISTEGGAFAPWENKCPIFGRGGAIVRTENEEEESHVAVMEFGTTVYGADINWDTGVMTVDRVKVSKTWGQMDNATDLGSGVTRKLCNKGSIGTLLPFSAESISNVCAYLGGGWNDPVIRWFHDDINAFFYLPSNTPNDLLCEWIAPLATPVTIQLTPTELQMLKGYNRVTLSDGYGTIELKALTGANWS